MPGLRREVRTEVERLAVGGQEHRHRPAALPGRGLHGLHVDGVDVGPLLAVDLDGDEVLVEVRGGRLVLEDSCAMTWHQWQAQYPTLSSTGTPRLRASSNASRPHGHQSTGLSACWSR